MAVQRLGLDLLSSSAEVLLAHCDFFMDRKRSPQALVINLR